MINKDRLRAAVQAANLPCLLMSVYQLTGDEKWLADPFRPRRPRGIDDDDTGGLSDETQAVLRSAAFDAVVGYTEGAPAVIPAPRGELLRAMMSTCVGEEVPSAFEEMVAAEMRFAASPITLDDDDAPDAQRPRVAVVGAGVGGLTVALTLKNAGIPFTVFERNADVGGVWFTNSYPGAGVDTPSFLYSWAFYPRSWSSHFAKRDEVLGYIRDMADEYGLRESIEFDTDVVSCTWDETRQHWMLRLRNGHIEQTVTADFVVSAVGVFSKPSLPDLPGLDQFGGPTFHSSLWPDALSVAGRRVAVVGTGASAMQIVPAIYREAEAVGVFQRSAQWIAPAEKYFLPVTDDVHDAMECIPFYRGWYRFHVAWIFGDKRHSLLQVDPEWSGHPNSINSRNDRLRNFLSNYAASELQTRPDLIAHAVPDYPPYAKRMLLDNGWYRALRSESVTLFGEPVAEVTPTSLRTASGREWEADVIVLCTGFEAVRFVQSIDIVGIGGRSLREAWSDDDARAYLGVMTPGFPNLFFIYGPNTNSGGGSFFSLAESQANYIARVLVGLNAKGLKTVEPTPAAFERYNHDIDAAHDHMIWSHPGVRSYYRNSAGRVVVNMPWRGVEYWNMISEPDFADFAVDGGTRP